MKVVQLREEPSLMDLPGQLRRLANEIEGQPIRTVMVITEDHDGDVDMAYFGPVLSRSEVPGLMLRAAMQEAREE